MRYDLHNAAEDGDGVLRSSDSRHGRFFFGAAKS